MCEISCYPVWLEGHGFVQRVGSESESQLGARLGWALTMVLGHQDLGGGQRPGCVLWEEDADCN